PGLGFMLYVLVQFLRESARGKRPELHPLDSLARQAHLGRVVMMDPLKKRSIKDKSQLKESPIGTTGNIVLLATMIGLAWKQATRGQTTEMPTIERGNSHAVRNQTDDLALAGEQGAPSNPP